MIVARRRKALGSLLFNNMVNLVSSSVSESTIFSNTASIASTALDLGERAALLAVVVVNEWIGKGALAVDAGVTGSM